MTERKTTDREPESLPPLEYALIVAGGKGTRFASRIPKQFHALSGRPVLLHTLDAFFRYSNHIRVVVVLPTDDIAAWKAMCNTYHYTARVAVGVGCVPRFQSVTNGLENIPEHA